MVDFETQRTLYNLCDPDETLTPGDARYVPIDALGTPGHRVRGDDWADKLARRVELSKRPVCDRVTGLPGSGKSTELRRLAQRLEQPRPHGADLLTVVIDAEHVFNLASPIDVPDIVFAIVHAVDAALLAAEGAPTGAAMKEGFLGRVWNLLTRTDVGLQLPQFAVTNAAKLVVEMKNRPTLRARVRQAVASSLSEILDEARDELIAMQGRAEQLGRAGIVVIVDSLEKLRGLSNNWEEVLASAEQVFADGAPYLRMLPVHVLYTIPTALISRRRFEDVQFMPMIKLHDRAGVAFEPGIDAAYELVTKRVSDEHLRHLFGDQLQARMRRLIDWSGGYPRELVRLLRSAVAGKSWPLSDYDFNRVINEVGDQYRLMIPASAYAWLARIDVDKHLTQDDDEHRRVADAMLSSNVVLRYLNDEDWFELHPAVRGIPGVAAEVRRLELEATLRAMTVRQVPSEDTPGSGA